MSAFTALSSDPNILPTRSDSLASSSSGVALSRRSRVRRSPIIEGPEKFVDPKNMVEPMVLSTEKPAERLHPEDLKAISPSASGTDNGPPQRPARSPQRLSANVEDLRGKLETLVSGGSPNSGTARVEFRTEEVPRVGRAESKNSFHNSKAGRRGASLPRLGARRKAKDSFDSSAPRSPANGHGPKNGRDSMLTQQTTTSSSVYPPSTSTGTDFSLPSPRSLVYRDEDNRISSYDPEDEAQLHEFDGDDVSYRLRLLVKNNYFLPPAHSKPSPLDFSSATLPPRKSSRPAAPTFLDLFRVGKSKSKPLTPEPSQPADHFVPVLRTTSDSTTASGYAPRPQARSLPQTPSPAPHAGGPQDRTGRVVVVREKMEDLLSAAKQAEQDIKTREVRKEDSHRDAVDAVIDPTDAVDLPPPPAGYPFAVQASAMHGFGIQESVGAALLADCLPPGSPGYMSSLDREEDAWRKALLHEAVGHSLNASMASSSISQVLSSPTSTRSATSPVEGFPNSGSVRIKRILDQRILVPPAMDKVEEASFHETRSSVAAQSQSPRENRSRGLSTPDLHPVSRMSYLPVRAETPGIPHTPLAPPPRRPLINPLYSLSQTDLPSSGTSALNSSKVVRKSVSTPLLSDIYELGVRSTVTPTPPPMPTLSLSPPPSHNQESVSSLHSRAGDSISIYSQYSGNNDDILVAVPDEQMARPSMSLSLPTDGRPSLSIYSQPSATGSAFYDAWSHRSSTSSPRVSAETARSRMSSAAPTPEPRYSTMSPPPRVSSSFANVALSPPPRTSSLHHKLVFQPKASSSNVPPSPTSPCDSTPHGSEIAVEPQSIMAPGPTTPPFPGSERRCSNHLSLKLNIPTDHIPVSIHSAPPQSPMSFFDSIQSHPNAMDDLDSSDSEQGSEFGDHGLEEDTTATTAVYIDPHTQAVSNRPSISSARPSLMRFGNHSTPYVAKPAEISPAPSLPGSDKSDRMKPVTNVPSRPRLFSFKKAVRSDHGHKLGPPLNFNPPGRHSSGGEPSGPSAFGSLTDLKSSLRRPGTSGNEGVRAWQNTERGQEELLRRFDGMLTQHMETERDTIKRIATSVGTSWSKS